MPFLERHLHIINFLNSSKLWEKLQKKSIVATEKSGLTSEVEAQKANAEQVLASASKAQNIIDKAPSLLAELNPMYKEKQETEQRFGKIEGSIGEMKELMKKQQEMMENFIKKFES